MIYMHHAFLEKKKTLAPLTNETIFARSNICVHFMRQKFGVDEHIEKVGWEHCCISEVTVAELLFGAERSNNVERNLQLVTDFCQDIKVIPLSSALCCYARSKAALYSQGTPIEDLDLFIGCTAVANQMIMVTENKKHLERIPNIEIENWVHRG